MPFGVRAASTMTHLSTLPPVVSITSHMSTCAGSTCAGCRAFRAIARVGAMAVIAVNITATAPAQRAALT